MRRCEYIKDVYIQLYARLEDSSFIQVRNICLQFVPKRVEIINECIH